MKELHQPKMKMLQSRFNYQIGAQILMFPWKRKIKSLKEAWEIQLKKLTMLQRKLFIKKIQFTRENLKKWDLTMKRMLSLLTCLIFHLKVSRKSMTQNNSFTCQVMFKEEIFNNKLM